jgi:hypothetical protein
MERLNNLLADPACTQSGRGKHAGNRDEHSECDDSDAALSIRSQRNLFFRLAAFDLPLASLDVTLETEPT